jgi:hypothetical protein
MTMDPKQFEENLLLYGADLNRWPEEIRQAGMESLQKYLELQVLLEEQEKFEKMLKARKYEEPSCDLTQRIVSVSLQVDRKSPFGLGSLFSRICADEFFLHKPASIIASLLTISVLAVGLFIGFSISTESKLTDEGQASLQEFLHYQGEALWAKR